MEQKPGWTYSFCNSLQMHIAINDKTGILYTEDKIMYTAQECNLLKKIKYEIPEQVHQIKKLFGGTIISL